MNSDQWDWVHRTLSSAAAWLLHTKAALLSGVRSMCSYQPRKSTNEADRLTVTFGNVLYKSPLTNSFETTCKTKSFLYLSVVTYYLDFSPWVNFQCRLPYSVCIAPVCTHACMHAHTNNTRVHTHNMLLVHHTHTHTEKKTGCSVSCLDYLWPKSGDWNSIFSWWLPHTDPAMCEHAPPGSVPSIYSLGSPCHSNPNSTMLMP